MIGSGTDPAAPALREGVRCALELAGAVAPLDCVVVEFDEQDVHVVVPALDADGRAALAQVAASAYLVFPGSRGSLHALRATVVESDRPGALALRLLDRFRLGQRRRSARAALALPARVEAGGAVTEAVSVDISTGGCRLHFAAPWPAADAATICFALGEAAEMRLEATLVRVDGLEASFAFPDPGAAERGQLSALVRAYNAAA